VAVHVAHTAEVRIFFRKKLLAKLVLVSPYLAMLAKVRLLHGWGVPSVDND
jgi:hypothetical protein